MLVAPPTASLLHGAVPCVRLKPDEVVEERGFFLVLEARTRRGFLEWDGWMGMVPVNLVFGSGHTYIREWRAGDGELGVLRREGLGLVVVLDFILFWRS